MLNVRLTLVASVAALALSIPSVAGAQSSPPTVFNFGHCVSSGDATDPQNGFGPLVFILGGQPGNGFFAHVPPGQTKNAESGSIGCAPNS